LKKIKKKKVKKLKKIKEKAAIVSLIDNDLIRAEIRIYIII